MSNYVDKKIERNDFVTMLKSKKNWGDRLDFLKKTVFHKEGLARIESAIENNLIPLSITDSVNDDIKKIWEESVSGKGDLMPSIEKLKNNLIDYVSLRFESFITELTSSNSDSKIPDIWGDELSHFYQNHWNENLSWNPTMKVLEAIFPLKEVERELFLILGQTMKDLWFEEKANLLFIKYWELTAKKEFK